MRESLSNSTSNTLLASLADDQLYIVIQTDDIFSQTIMTARTLSRSPGT